MNSTNPSFSVDFETVQKIIRIAKDAQIASLTVEKGDFKVKVCTEIEKDRSIQTSVVSKPTDAQTPAEKISDEEGVVAITSPMVGTFYRASSPDSAPYVQEGDEVEQGKTVCIVEAMKLFNEIESDFSGTVKKILVDNGQPVEFGQKLMLIKKR